jgi:uncharacterized protein with PQ loop repeat
METFKEFLKLIFDIGMYFNIVALLPQPMQIWKTKSSENVSVWMWVIFFSFQAAISLHGKLNLHSTPMFFGMGGSALVSLTTLILCIMYKKPKQVEL